MKSRFPVPILQCLQIKPLAVQMANGQPAPPRYRVVMSDLRNYIQCMLATQITHVVTEGKIARGNLVRIKEYQPNNVKGKK